MTAQPERPLVSIEAEHGVLGALMIEPALCEPIGAFLGAEYFADGDRASLYSLILTSRSKGHAPDPITLSEIRPDLPSGEPTLVFAAEIMRNVPSAANGMAYARIVLDRYKARQLFAAGQRLKEISTSKGKLADQIAQAQALTMGLSAEDGKPDVVKLRDAMTPIFDEMESRWKGEEAMGLDTGLIDLDKIVRGLRPGQLIVIAGRPGTGKTVLGTGFADHVAIRNGGVALVFSLEMSKEEIAKRSLAALSGVEQNLIDSGKALDDDDANNRMIAAVNRVANSDVRICDRPALTVARICAIARLEHRVKPLDLIVIDYLGLIGSDSKYQTRAQEIGSMTRALKALAKELGIPVVLLAQLNRSIESRGDAKPRMSDLRDSGEIEQDADVIMIAHRDMASEKGRSGLTEIDVVKCRHGAPGYCLLRFQGEFARFVNAMPSDYEEEPKETAKPSKSARAKLTSVKEHWTEARDH